MLTVFWEPIAAQKHIFVGYSFAYFDAYRLGDIHVLELCLLLASVYFALKGKWFAPILLVLGSFDPRFTLEILPLFSYGVYRSKQIMQFIRGCLFTLILIVPFLLYYNVLGQYLAFHQIKITVFYNYEWVPFYGILAVSIGFLLLEIIRTVNSRYVIKQNVNLTNVRD